MREGYPPCGHGLRRARTKTPTLTNAQSIDLLRQNHETVFSDSCRFEKAILDSDEIEMSANLRTLHDCCESADF
jgi:hypothetical protein